MAGQGEGGGLGPQGEILWLTMTREKQTKHFMDKVNKQSSNLILNLLLLTCALCMSVIKSVINYECPKYFTHKCFVSEICHSAGGRSLFNFL